ncbi:MAG: hypothetical protein H6815_08475 [Phycisphaeraceae bacterium]|nr:hypothetical protein [Phycisphaerales bacterium]MCB9860476.1 hypothetical protein [Phycisphaeraceae bacterium]
MQTHSENRHEPRSDGHRRSVRAHVGWFDLKRVLIPFVSPIIVVVAALGSSLWIAQTYKSHVLEHLDEEARGAVSSVASALQPLLMAKDIESVSRVVKAAAQSEWIAEVRVTLPDGSIIANSSSESILQQLPETWERSPMTPVSTSAIPDGVNASMSFIVPERGTVRLGVDTIAPPNQSPSTMIAGVWVLAAAAALTLAWTQRLVRQNQRGVSALRSALLAIHDQGLTPDALRIHPGFGAEATAWNMLVRRLQGLDENDIAQRAQGALSSAAVENRVAISACSALPIGLIVIDADMHVQLSNGAGLNLLGLPSKSDNLITLAQNNAPYQLVEAIQGLISGDRVHSTLEIEQDNDGTKGVLRVVARRIPQSNPSLVVALIEDVTQQRIAQQSRDVFVAQATHDLRTPLTNIRLYAESMLEDHTMDQSARDQAVNVINRESRRLERIVNDMLSVSEMDSGSYTLHRDDVRTEQLLHEIEADYEAQARDKNITLTFNLPPKLPILLGERDKLAMAIHNLVGNALKYTPDGGTVTVDVQAETSQLSISVTDTGIGISEDMLPRVFDRFYRAQDDRVATTTGSGLGLALAREVVRLHGGEITADSILNEGSTFKIILPVLAHAA